MQEDGLTIANVRVGRPDVTMAKPAHVRGVHEGNNPPRRLVRTAGLVEEEDGITRGTARRSTGINAKAREPIDPRSPCLSPA